MPIDRTPPIVTVLGGGGFIGRYVCEMLLREGVRLRVAERDPRRAFFLQPLARVGQIAFVAADLARPRTLAPAIEGADAVVNLVGSFKGDLDAIHASGAEAAAKAAREAGAASFVHVSAIGADPEAASFYASSKGKGEAAVRAAFANATIIRPSVVFGAEDALTNRFATLARMPMVPVIAPRTRFQPLFVKDLAAAIAVAALDPDRHGGRTYELAGPEAMTMIELNRKVAAMAGRNPDFVELPSAVSSLIASFGFLPGAPLTRDQLLMLQADNVAGGKLPGLEAFGIAPTALEIVAPEWLGRFRDGGRFAVREIRPA